MTDYLAPPVAAPRQAPARSPRARTLLVALAAALSVAAAVSATLYIRADGAHDAAVALLDTRRAELADARVAAVRANAVRRLTEEQNSGLEAERAALTACVDAVHHYLWDGLEGAQSDAALDAMFEACQ